MDYSYRGKYTQEFDKKISEFTKIPYVVSTNSGTSALHLALICSGIKQNTEILVPALTFVGSVNPIMYHNCIPHFIDCQKDIPIIDNLLLDKYLSKIVDIKRGYSYNKLTGKRISGIIIVHLLGIPCEMEGLLRIALKYNLKVIEDCAQALGTFINGRSVGSFGHCGAFSFNGNKIITTGGGGAFITNDLETYRRALSLSMVAKDYTQERNYHNEVGYNYRMPSLNAKMGLKEIKSINKRIKKNYNKYLKLRGKYNRTVGGGNFWRSAVITSEKIGQPVWTLINELPMYKNCPKMDLTNSKLFELNARLV